MLPFWLEEQYKDSAIKLNFQERKKNVSKFLDKLILSMCQYLLFILE